ncbi:MAG TPA: amidohydrolase family protein, partial [Armatimonadaceae bacterium]|nr:amidohydrolase family protein [Armatimonadaceae bacterium]
MDSSRNAADGETLLVRGARRVVAESGVITSGSLLCSGGRVAEVFADSAPAVADRVVDASGLTVLPGFLDVHIHGGGGADTMDATPDALRAILRMHAAHGTTGLLLTTMTQSRERIDAALACAAGAVGQG